MKNQSFLFLFTLFFSMTLSTHLMALDTALEVNPGDLTEAIKNVTNLEKKLDKTGAPAPDCAQCKTIEPDKKMDLKSKTEDLGTPALYKNNVSFVYHLKRTKDTPLKTTLKFKNGRKVCAKTFIGANPFNGALIIDCIIYQTIFEDEELDLNFKNLPLPADGEEQVIEIKFTKPQVENSYYTVEADILKGPQVKISKDKKFWGTGYNFDFAGRVP